MKTEFVAEYKKFSNLKTGFFVADCLEFMQSMPEDCVDLRINEFHKRYLTNDEFYYVLYDELKFSIAKASLHYKDW